MVSNLLNCLWNLFNKYVSTEVILLLVYYIAQSMLKPVYFKTYSSGTLISQRIL